jgi:zinc transporter ZupT
VALGAGTLAFYFPRVGNGNYKLALVFAGAYLFSITVIHILPELFRQDVQPGFVGMFVLAGFFLQQGLEFLSTGVEHGHIHVYDAGHHHKGSSAILVLVALGVHALLEGGMLAHPRTVEHHHDSNTLLWGILLHKAPEAFALMSVLLCELKSKIRALVYLVLFAAASPLGLYLSDFLLTNQVMSSRAFTFLFALVSGNFLHISTTIVFESSLDHKFNARKTGVAVLAGGLAVTAELVF